MYACTSYSGDWTASYIIGHMPFLPWRVGAWVRACTGASASDGHRWSQHTSLGLVLIHASQKSSWITQHTSKQRHCEIISLKLQSFESLPNNAIKQFHVSHLEKLFYLLSGRKHQTLWPGRPLKRNISSLKCYANVTKDHIIYGHARRRRVVPLYGK